MDYQVAFDKAVSGIIAQGGPATEDERSDTCMYRAPNRRKCGVGHLISDEDYFPDMENAAPVWASGTPTAIRVAKAAGARSSNDATFLRHIQTAHDVAVRDTLLTASLDSKAFDNDAFFVNFKRRAVKLAEQYALNPAVALG